MPLVENFTRHSINSMIRHACDLNGIPWLANLIYFEFNDRLTSIWGRAHRDERIIELSTLLWLGRPEKRYDTVVHEVCHIIVWEKYGHSAKPHGKEWRRCMKRANLKPKSSEDGIIIV
jgi:SprT protein